MSGKLVEKIKKKILYCLTFKLLALKNLNEENNFLVKK